MSTGKHAGREPWEDPREITAGRRPLTTAEFDHLVAVHVAIERNAKLREKEDARARKAVARELELKAGPCSHCGASGRQKRQGTRLCESPRKCADLGELAAWLIEHDVPVAIADDLASALYSEHPNFSHDNIEL